MIRSAIMVALAALTLIGSANASTIHYRFTGTINDVRDYTGTTGVAGYIPYGTSFTGTFDYDPDAALSYLVDANRGVFAAPSTPTSTQIGNYTFDKGTNQLQLLNGNPGLYFLSSDQTDFSDLPASMGGFGITTRIQLYGSVANLTLPRTLNLTTFPGFIGITGYSAAGAPPSYFAWHVAGDLSSLELINGVPEPATWCMMLVGFGAMGYAMRRRAKVRTNLSFA